ncbi:MAG: ECF transporter S component [Agathobacter sp.]
MTESQHNRIRTRPIWAFTKRRKNNAQFKTNELVLTGLFTAIIIIMAFTPLGYIPLVVINATIIHIPVILGSLFCGPKKGAFLGFVFGFTSCLKATIVGGTLSSFVFSPVLAASLVGTSGIFKSLFIAFVPRILVGVIPYFVYIGIKKVLASEKKNLWGTVLNVLMSAFLAFGVYAFLGKMSESLSQAAALGIGIAVGAVVFIVVEAVFIRKSTQVIPFVYAGVAGAMTNTLLVMGSIFVLYKDAYADAIGVAGNAVLGVITGVISFNGVIEAIVAAIIVYLVGLVLNTIKPIAAK